MSLSVGYGSNQEPEEAAGIAHFLEHMLAGGSTLRIHRSRGIEDWGGVLDFYTDREQVTASLDVLPSKAVDAAEVIAELFFGGCFEEDKFLLERKIILNELAEVADDPTVKVEELLLENLFRHHPIRRPVGGYCRTVKKLSLTQLTDEYRGNYVPKNMVLVVSGNIGSGNQRKVSAPFEKLEFAGFTPKQHQPIEKGKPKPVAVEEKAGITQSYLSIGARTIPSTHKDAPALDLISNLLGGGTSSRLFIELREKNAVTYDVSAAHCKGSDFGYLGVSCAVGRGKVKKARALILKEFASLGAMLVSEVELEKAKQIMLGGVFRGMDNPHDSMEIINYMELQFQKEDALKNYLDKVRGVTVGDIQDAANRYLSRECLCTAILNPIKQR
jgi:predicted Zn-dependent peptidase